MITIHDGPASSRFTPLTFHGNADLGMLEADPALQARWGLSSEMTAALKDAPRGSCVSWGIPFEIGEVAVVAGEAVDLSFSPTRARWLVFLHTSDVRPLEAGADGFIAASSGSGRLAEHAADYVVGYADGSTARAVIRRRHQLGAIRRHWGENCFQAVAHHKPHPMRGGQEQMAPDWGYSQTRATAADDASWVNWLWAWENPHPEKEIAGLRLEPGKGVVVLSALTAGDVDTLPLRWETRRKACLRLPEGVAFQPDLDDDGLLKQVQLDLGQVISATRRLVYPNADWAAGYNNQPPDVSPDEILIEYAAHPQACFHLSGGQVIPVAALEESDGVPDLRPVPTAQKTVAIRVVPKGGGKPLAVKLHLHGEWGEYLAPVDRHRIINASWFEDYSADFAHIEDWSNPARRHSCTYIPGETQVKLPLGKVFLEVSKGFEIRPVRKVVQVSAETEEIIVEVEKVLPWREKGWVTADTHVHFLSPMTAMLEGAGEGVNVVNLLASQWGELMTNVGDFDGHTTWGSKEAGGDGEYLVRVGTENRQHVLGHISLLGYSGQIIAPMTTGGADESAIGDGIETLLTEWARQCRRQGGLVVLPHFPNPRAEHAASIVCGDIDALEMTSWGDHYSGIDPYSLSDWYRYLNCGYLVPAVAGTDKMSASTAVGTVRTYARVDPQQAFTYQAWMDAVRRGETFASYGPLLEFNVDGRPMGSRIQLPATGGTLDVSWQVASVTVPVTRVELIVNGEIRESLAVEAAGQSGHWSIRLERSGWLALLVRGAQPGRREMIAAHSSPVMVEVAGSPLLAAADAVTILEQIEGAMAYLDTVGTRADERAARRMRLVLESAHRALHNRMHQMGHFHEHTPPTNHPEHG